MQITRRLKENLKGTLHDVFLLGQRLGVDILPRHYYSAIPDIRGLKRSDSWKNAASMIGVAGTDLQAQLSYLYECCTPFDSRLRKGGIHQLACEENGESGYGSVESDLLYCLIAKRQPKSIIQIGAGVSTAVILLAARDAQYAPQILCIDPFPTRYLLRLEEQQSIKLVREEAQRVDIETLTRLDPGDLLFIDSTHAVRPGSEVNRLILEVLPRIPSGCLVHFHDIYFPYDYQASVLETLFFSAESTLLHAFLINNSKYSIALSLSMLHHRCPDQLKRVFPNYVPAAMDHGLKPGAASGDFPSATYLLVR